MAPRVKSESLIWAALAVSLCLAQTALAVVPQITTCEQVAVADGPCNDKSTGSYAYVPSVGGSIPCQLVSTTCSRFDGFVCENELCQAYAPLPVNPAFSGWKLGPPSAISCNQICNAPAGSPTGCNALQTSLLVGLQTTVNLYNILGLYNSMITNHPNWASIYTNTPNPPFILFSPGGLLLFIRQNVAPIVDCGLAAGPSMICCCSSDGGLCQLPSDPQYNVVIPV